MKESPKKVEKDFDDIIEILSSPEKSPFKEDRVDHFKTHDEVEKAKRQIFPSKNVTTTYLPPKSRDQECIMLSSDSDSTQDEDRPTIKVETESVSEDEDDHEKQDDAVELEFKKYKGDKYMELYQAFTSINRGLTADEIIHILLHPGDYDICETVPQYVQKPLSFLVDTRNLKDRHECKWT